LPIDQHPIFQAPPPTLALWRYTNFAKFVSLVTTKSLWFSNMYHLSRDDPFEGALPVGNFAHRDWTLETLPAEIRKRLELPQRPFETSPEERLGRLIEAEDETIRHVLRSTKEYFINCWHGASTESAAMWKLYAEDNYGIAIVSDSPRIASALEANSENIFCGTINYIDYDREKLDISNAFTPTLTKRRSFEHEREVRLLHWDTSIGDEQVLTLWKGEPRVMWTAKSHADHAAIDPPGGKTFACDLEKLIKEIRIAPTAPVWFEAAVRDFCDIAGLKKPIIKSDLTRSPMR